MLRSSLANSLSIYTSGVESSTRHLSQKVWIHLFLNYDEMNSGNFIFFQLRLPFLIHPHSWRIFSFRYSLNAKGQHYEESCDRRGGTWAEVQVDKSLQVLCVTTGQQTLGSYRSSSLAAMPLPHRTTTLFQVGEDNQTARIRRRTQGETVWYEEFFHPR